jgi:hypothetical protein
MKTVRIAAGIAMLIAAAPGQAVAAETTFYFECLEPVKVQNVMGAVAAPSWSTEPPTGSLTEGAGCGYADVGGHDVRQPDAVFGGVYGGAIDRMELELHNLTSRVRNTYLSIVDTRISVDGEEVASSGHLVRPKVSESGVTEVYELWLPHDIPAGAADRRIEIAVNHTYETAFGTWLFGATEVPSKVTIVGT